MLVDNFKMKEVDFFDENTFLYAEEPIIAERLKKKNYQIAYYDSIYVKHLHGQTTALLKNKNKLLIELDSLLYYFREYKDFNKFELLLIKYGYLWDHFVLRPTIRFIKNTIKNLAKGRR